MIREIPVKQSEELEAEIENPLRSKEYIDSDSEVYKSVASFNFFCLNCFNFLSKNYPRFHSQDFEEETFSTVSLRGAQQ